MLSSKKYSNFNLLKKWMTDIWVQPCCGYVIKFDPGIGLNTSYISLYISCAMSCVHVCTHSDAVAVCP